ncbi:uncharacterized protein A1O5_03351 [Cladophialophora psammophila CBS 110553]|uniref:BTB domain-containing protein n=1 Tax=Cladophialophora psammophila CBS 110553 TaxID=1182543 RepID=W9XTH1_9EURO|nr:uncharacterized protein A1O5_03351 [Cladophialophora psammophila CBS 110553]EXJ73589.1 hypothetical protein A1O5_03351 [Cladophialophora psammophila CBS 110553]
MQCPSFGESLRSPTFQFLVGLERTAYNVHSNLAVQLSPVFAALINGNMVESIERRAILDDIDEDTFLRFCEYAYKGDFSVPPPKIVVDPKFSSSPQLKNPTTDEITSSHSATTHADGCAEKFFESSKGVRLNRLAEDLCPPFNNKRYNPGWKDQICRPGSWLRRRKSLRNSTNRTTNILAETAAVPNLPDRNSKLGIDWAKFCNVSPEWGGPVFYAYKNYTPSESFTETLLAQAKLYVFCDRYIVEPLRSLVLYKMQRTLASLNLFPERVPEIFLLIQYIYENTSDGDDLRTLLTQFAACMITVLIQHPDWGIFIREQRSFTSELLQHLRKSVETV